MNKILLLIACILCLLLCACTPHNGDSPSTTPASTGPMPTPGMTVIAPTETPAEHVEPIDPNDEPIVIPIETPDTSDEDDPSPGTPPVITPEPTPSPTPSESSDGDKVLPWVPY